MKLLLRYQQKQNVKDRAETHTQECNYANNYYGDQVCVAPDKKGK